MACWDCRHRTVETGGLAPKESQTHAYIWVASLLASWRVSLGGKDGKMAGLQLAKNPITSFWKCKFDGGRSLPTRDVMAVASRYSWQKAETLRSSCKALPWCCLLVSGLFLSSGRQSYTPWILFSYVFQYAFSLNWNTLASLSSFLYKLFDFSKQSTNTTALGGCSFISQTRIYNCLLITSITPTH